MLNDLYESKQLSHCSLSHYCYYMKQELLLMLDIMDGKSPIEDKEYGSKLGKFPSKTYGLCDRGFRRTSMSYPNLNRILYPSFITEADVNKQFSKDHLSLINH